MKKNVIFRIAAIVLMCTLVTACFASSTFAKYTSKVTADTATATVAKWSIQVGADKFLEASPAPEVTFNIFDTINHHHAKDVQTKVAPGTWGEFTIDAITNKSEVTANVAVKVESYSNPQNIPIKFYETKGGTDDAPVFSDEITIAEALKLIDTDLGPNEATDAKTIYWEWNFTSNGDTNDTALGVAAKTAAPTYTITLSIEATQLDK